MSIEYYLLNNPLSDEPDQQVARVHARGKKNLNDIVTLIVERGSTLGEPDIYGVLTELGHVIVKLLKDGNSVWLPFACFKSSIKGTFTNHIDGFDPSRHTLRPIVGQGPLLKDLYGGNALHVEKIDNPLKAPEIKNFVDMTTGERNRAITPGGMGTVLGKRLKFNPENESEGVYFVAVGTNEETKVSFIGTNTANRLVFMIPAGIVAGDYVLQVRVLYGEKIRTGVLDDILTVS